MERKPKRYMWKIEWEYTAGIKMALFISEAGEEWRFSNGYMIYTVLFRAFKSIEAGKPFISIVDKTGPHKLYPANKQALDIMCKLHIIISWVSTGNLCAGVGWSSHGGTLIKFPGSSSNLMRLVVMQYIKNLNRDGPCDKPSDCKIHPYKSKKNIYELSWDTGHIDPRKMKCETVTADEYKSMTYHQRDQCNWEVVMPNNNYSGFYSLNNICRVVSTTDYILRWMEEHREYRDDQEWMLNRIPDDQREEIKRLLALENSLKKRVKKYW